MAFLGLIAAVSLYILARGSEHIPLLGGVQGLEAPAELPDLRLAVITDLKG